MDIDDAQRMAEALISHFGETLSGWEIRFDNAKTRLGECNSQRMTISLSRPVVELNAEEVVRDTILHEIAHALVGTEAGHSKEWKECAKRIGATPERLANSESIVRPDMKPRKRTWWVGECPSCRKVYHRHRRRKFSCDACSPGKPDERFKLIWTRPPDNLPPVVADVSGTIDVDGPTREHEQIIYIEMRYDRCVYWQEIRIPEWLPLQVFPGDKVRAGDIIA